MLSTLKVGLLRTTGIILYQRTIFNRQQGNNDIINNVVDEILLNETKKVSAAREAPECLESDCDKNHLYQVEK